MLLINNIQLYSFRPESDRKALSINAFDLDGLDKIGNPLAKICCFIACDSSISESKDYKILSKVFEKLMLKVENVLTINTKSCEQIGFAHIIHEFKFSKAIIFGEDAILPNFPLNLKINQPTKFEFLDILLSENLVKLTESTNSQLKQTCWNAIQTFYKI
jgi:hypothetical protein